MTKPVKTTLSIGFALLILLYFIFKGGTIPIGFHDFQGYWGASSLLASGERFNDHTLLLDLQRSLNTDVTDTAIMTWNPPWILALLIPLANLPFYDAALIWLLGTIFVFVWCLEAIWSVWPNNESIIGRKIWLYASLALFYPFWQTVGIGQLIALLLFAYVATIKFHRSRPFIAGFLFSFLTAKPHLVLITMPLILLDQLRNRNWPFLAGFFTSISVLTTTALIYRPSLFTDYFTPTGSPLSIEQLPAAFPLYTLASWIGWIPFRFIGVILTIIVVLYWMWRQPATDSEWSFLILAIGSQVLSMLIAPYGFPFDFILLLPAIWGLLMFTIQDNFSDWRSILIITCLLGSFISLFVLQISQFTVVYFSWFPLIACLIYVYIHPLNSTR